ncbi:MAG: DNA gyrase modulator, partial [bacterium]
MKEIAQKVLNCLQLRKAQYGDVRIIRRRTEELTVRNETPEVVKSTESLGVGVRVYHRGGWGFAATSELTDDAFSRAVSTALELSKASRSVRRGAEPLEMLPARTGHYATPIRRNPFNVSLDDKLSLLLDTTRLMLKERNVKITLGFLDFFAEEKYFADTTGSFLTQDLVETGGGILAYAMDKD